MLSKFSLVHWNGQPMDIGLSGKLRTINQTDEYVAGMCSVLLLLSESVGESYMVIQKTNTINPENFCHDYFMKSIHLTKSLLTDLRNEKTFSRYRIIMGHMGTYMLFQFHSVDFLEGIANCCKILQRDHNKLIVEHNYTKHTYEKWNRSLNRSSVDVIPSERKLSVSIA